MEVAAASGSEAKRVAEVYDTRPLTAADKPPSGEWQRRAGGFVSE